MEPQSTGSRIHGAPAPRTKPGPWPVRTDTHLRAGIAEHDVERWAQSASLLQETR